MTANTINHVSDSMWEVYDQVVNGPFSYLWKNFARNGRFVDAIKELRAHSGLGLKDAKDIVDIYLYNNNLDRRGNKVKTEQTWSIASTECGATRTVTEHSDGTYTLTVNRTTKYNNLVGLLEALSRQ